MEEVRKYFVRDNDNDVLVSIEAEKAGENKSINIALDPSDPDDGIWITAEQGHALNLRLVAALDFVDGQ